ncbi:hypothetical protein NGI46_24180 [Peribacillus butanolivorans]|uniref:hypothetical protein n=1 Tax=Peribacillus butanolivorans TaxID=421767 RepID=UPI00207D2322|nr:hypothetical protein [Peribacillus butanolivorans]MCO0600447.1 hypothetical protein [Peribacillus butanolivorans]
MKRFKKLVVGMLIGFVAFGVFDLSQPTPKAAAYSGCKSSELPNVTLGATDLDICVSESGSNVNVSMKIFNNSTTSYPYYEWTMYLQRYTNGAWSNVGSRTGYISGDSSSNRTFTNVADKNTKMRVKAVFSYEGGGSVGTRYSNTWTR